MQTSAVFLCIFVVGLQQGSAMAGLGKVFEEKLTSILNAKLNGCTADKGSFKIDVCCVKNDFAGFGAILTNFRCRGQKDPAVSITEVTNAVKEAYMTSSQVTDSMRQMLTNWIDAVLSTKCGAVASNQAPGMEFMKGYESVAKAVEGLKAVLTALAQELVEKVSRNPPPALTQSEEKMGSFVKVHSP